MAAPASTRRFVTLALVGMTVLALFVVAFRLRLDPNVASLLPDQGEAAALRRYVRGFGGGDLAVVLVEGPEPETNAKVASEIASALAERPSVARAADRIDASRALDPMLAFRHADPRAMERLRGALTPEGIRARLAESRAMLLAPGSGAVAEVLATDPLRLGQLVHEGADISAGVRTQPDGAFATDDGRAHLVLVAPRGQALRGEDARRFVEDTAAVLAPHHAAHPEMRLGLTGGHAIAAATEEMLTRDLSISGALATVLASLVFALIFRRVRALVAVMPPLLLGTVWTAAVAAALPRGLSAIAVAFMSVVVGVGVDTGVHVYAALLEARRAGLGPREAARAARAKTAKSVLFAAGTAAAAFGALSLSSIEAMQQLGLLCAAGEVLTAAAIVLVTPEIGALLERRPPPEAPPVRWTDAFAWLSGTRRRAAVLAFVALVPVVAVLAGAAPSLSESIVAVRPKELEPLKVQQAVFDAFGGKSGQWVVLVADRDLERARARSDRLAEALSAMKDDVEAVDALTALAPAGETQEARFAARDALDLPAKASELEKALVETGFAPARFSAVLDAMRAPPRDVLQIEDLRRGPASILLSRYLGMDEGEHLVALYVRPRGVPGAAARVEEALRRVDPEAKLTGYARLEVALRESLASDLPKIAGVAALLVVAALAMSLRRARDVVIAAVVVLCEIAAVLLLVRLFGIPLHAYDALVLPVLLGITVDEGMFLLHRAREAEGDVIRETLRFEGPPVAATALTTATGFAALALCRFDGLRDLGLVGALGSVAGLVVALVVVPAGLRLWRA
ncbi:MMPL family transporter [Polyangium spumosum]|uniref:MMPL family transporter n=1 Tax=Polyangium spumosum TaxID=889282 RepID=A0A6N7PXD8_9BACT|nr:MMPL family transporter [Polyangium spumosum]MRG96902.1 MMPL family transporter [Polyangium spumosum]